MAKVQYAYLQTKTSESGQSGTTTYDLPEAGFVPEIIVRAFSTPTASTNPALPLTDAITKIEIVDGSRVIQSLSGNQLKALEMFRGKKRLTLSGKGDNAAESYEDFKFILGGMINNVRYAPDFSRFSNPQIKISWDYSQTTTEFGMTCDADASPAMKFTVIAKIVRGGGKYTHGYIKSSEIKTWTQAASTTTVTEIPRGDPLLGLMVEAGYDAKEFTDDINELKLDFDNGDWIPLDIDAEEVIQLQEDFFDGPFEVSFRADVIDGKDFDLHMNYVISVDGTHIGAESDYAIYHWPSAPDGVETLAATRASDGSAISTYHQAAFNVVGYFPFNCMYIPMSKLMDGSTDTIDTNQYGRIELETVSGSSASTSSTPAVIAEYLITR